MEKVRGCRQQTVGVDKKQAAGGMQQVVSSRQKGSRQQG
jgi:hypothetical protein